MRTLERTCEPAEVNHTVQIPLKYMKTYITQKVHQHLPDVGTCMCCFEGFEWWMAEGYLEAACQPSVLRRSRAERSCCCVWGSKPAVWIVCFLPGFHWNICLSVVHCKSKITPQYITHESVCEPWGCCTFYRLTKQPSITALHAFLSETPYN